MIDNRMASDGAASDNSWRQQSLTSIRYCFELFATPDRGETGVLEYLANNIVGLDPDSWQQRLEFGGVYYNGLRILEDRVLQFPCRIEYYLPKFNLHQAQDYYPEISAEDIIYRRDGLLAIFKPAGLPSMPAKDQLHHNLKNQVSRLLGAASHVHMPSRLDTSVSGLILMSEDPKLHNGLQKLYERKQIVKRYLALVDGQPEWSEREIDLPIGRDPDWGVLRRIDYENGRPSATFVQNLGQSGVTGKFLLAAYPKTGRTHQIRLHLASIGHPIVGDRFYGAIFPEALALKLHLISHSVQLRHPRTGQDIALTIPESRLPGWASDSGWSKI